jgi:hypothetical protein
VRRQCSAWYHVRHGLRTFLCNRGPVASIACCNVREMHSEFVICALAPSGGARDRRGFHRSPLCEPIRFLGRDRCVYHIGWDEAGRQITIFYDRYPLVRLIEFREIFSHVIAMLVFNAIMVARRERGPCVQAMRGSGGPVRTGNAPRGVVSGAGSQRIPMRSLDCWRGRSLQRRGVAQ